MQNGFFFFHKRILSMMKSLSQERNHTYYQTEFSANLGVNTPGLLPQNIKKENFLSSLKSKNEKWTPEKISLPSLSWIHLKVFLV